MPDPWTATLSHLAEPAAPSIPWPAHRSRIVRSFEDTEAPDGTPQPGARRISDEQILEVLRTRGPRRVVELAAVLKFSEQGVRKRLEALKKAGRVERTAFAYSATSKGSG